jgi:hypothetical protein
LYLIHYKHAQFGNSKKSGSEYTFLPDGSY